MEAKRAKMSGVPDESSNHPVWSILIPRLDLVDQMALSMTSSTLRHRIATHCEDKLQYVTNRLKNNPKHWARQMNNPSECLELPNPGWAFYRALIKLQSRGTWSRKSALVILRKTQKIAETMMTQ